MAAPEPAPTRRADALAAVCYSLLAVGATFPLIARLGSAVPATASDMLLQIWAIWWRKISLLGGLDYRVLSLSHYPFGTDNVKWFFRLGYTTILAVVSMLTGEVAAYNLSILGGLALTALLTYRLAAAISGSRAAGLAAGLIVGFSPYALSHAFAHGGLTQMWVLPLFLLALRNLRRRQSPGPAILLGGAFVLALDVHGYYGYFAALSALVFAGVQAARRSLTRRALLLYALAALAAIILYLPVLLPMLRAYYGGGVGSPLRSPLTLERSDDWFFWLSSRPWSFVLPPEQHPLLGDLARRINDAIAGIGRLDFTPASIARRFPTLDMRWLWQTSPQTRADSYLGLTTLALAARGIVRWRRGRIAGGEEPGFWLPFALALTVTALLFSLPPYLPVGAPLRPLSAALGDLTIPTPALLTLTVAPPLRSGSFFVLLMLIGLCLPAAVGLADWLAAAPSPRRRAARLAAALALIGLEFARLPVLRDVTPPPEVAWLAAQPPGTPVAVYPFGDRRAAIHQRLHGQPTLDSPSEDPLKDNLYWIELWTLGDPAAPDLAPRLAALGMRYLLNLGEPLAAPPDGTRLVSESEAAQLYAVTAEPAPLAVLATLRGELWVSEGGWAWPGDPPPLTVWNPLNEPAAARITVQPAGPLPDGLRLEAARRRTPLPETLIWSGMTIPNPLRGPDYPPEPVAAVRRDGALIFDRVEFAPGETILTLTWRGGDPIPVAGVTFSRIAAP